MESIHGETTKTDELGHGGVRGGARGWCGFLALSFWGKCGPMGDQPGGKVEARDCCATLVFSTCSYGWGIMIDVKIVVPATQI